MPSSYAIALDLRDRRVVVVGGGDIAERKVGGLLAAGAKVAVVAPEVVPALRRLALEGRIEIVERRFVESDVDGARLIFAVTGDPAVNGQVVAAARSRNVLVDDASDGRRGDFTTALVHRVGPLTFAIDTGGLAPSFAKRVRDELAATFDTRYGEAAEAVGRARSFVLARVAPPLRARVMHALAGLDIDALASLQPSALEEFVVATVAQLEACACDHVVEGHGAALEGPLVAATRASPLALRQTQTVMSALALHGVASTILEVSTRGDRIHDRALDALGGDGIFVKELERALRERRADYAVHSCKDLPSVLPRDMRIVAIGPREDARDAFCSERFPSLALLPPGSIVGTSSPRRRAQLLATFPALRVETIRGNVDTRLRHLREGRYDAIVLAMAGLLRLSVRATFVEPIEPATMLPAPGQGALAIECRAADAELAARISAAFGDVSSELAVTAERAFLREMRGGCQAPLGAFARWEGRSLRLEATLLAPDGSRQIRAQHAFEVSDAAGAERLGVEVARDLLGRADGQLLREALPARERHEAGDELPLAGRIFLLPRTQARPSRIAAALRTIGAEVVEAADEDDALAGLAGRTPHVLLFPSSGSVRALAGYLAALETRTFRPIVAAMGEASSAAARAAGFPPDVVAAEATTGAFVQNVTRYVLRGDRP
jgi:hydroxymethylbilane synthase